MCIRDRVYFAPEGAGTYHLTLRAATADGHKLKQTVEVRVLPILSVEPLTAQTGLNGSVAFTLTLKGLPRNSVKWTVDEPDGGEGIEGAGAEADYREAKDVIHTLTPLPLEDEFCFDQPTARSSSGPTSNHPLGAVR